jgi:nucleoside-diphosphate-sugar epimerase
MEIAVTGGNGRLGRALIGPLLAHGHNVRNIDRVPPKEPLPPGGAERFIHLDLADLPAVTEAIRGCDAVAHLAALPGPQFKPEGIAYVNNTIASFNVLRAASTLGVKRLCLASSINAIGGLASRAGRFDYFPVDEKHPTYNADDYSLGKWVMEQQADSFARRCPDMTISSLRFHALPDDPPELVGGLVDATNGSARGLWGWTLMSEAARACELALNAKFTGHEVFFIVAPRTGSSVPSMELARYAYPNVPIRGDLSGHKSFYDCSKAARMLGWVHKD